MVALTYLLSGINIGVAFIVFLIAWKNGRDRSYFLFGLFSLFSGLYFLSSSIPGFGVVTILFAATYYSAFAMFISNFADLKKPLISAGLVLLFGIAFVLFVINPEAAAWQLAAHIGLVGLILLLIYASVQLYTNQRKGSLDFWVVSILFSLLAIEEITTTHFDSSLISQYFSAFPPLDIFPFLFTIIIGKRLALDIYKKSQLELELVQAELQEEQAKLQESERKRLETELSFKQKDLTDFGLEISRCRDFLNQLTNQLTDIKSKPSSKQIQESIASIRSFVGNDKSAALLQENVNQVNHEFIQKLKSKFPELSKNEIQICLLLRLQLSSKEIASIKNISADSLKVLRYRLRKKLELSSDVNLSEFMQSL